MFIDCKYDGLWRAKQKDKERKKLYIIWSIVFNSAIFSLIAKNTYYFWWLNFSFWKFLRNSIFTLIFFSCAIIEKFTLESMIYVIFAIKHFLFPFHSFSLQFKNKHYNVDIVFSLFAIQFQMNYTSIVLYCLLSYSITHYFNFNFNGWVFQCVCACVCVHSLLFVMNHFDFDTHFGWPMVKRSENLKFITNHLFVICCILLFRIIRFKSNQ